MRVKRKIIQALGCAAVAIGMVGCSGINTSHSISPATFLLPGFTRHDAPRTPPSSGPVAPTTLDSPVQYN